MDVLRNCKCNEQSNLHCSDYVEKPRLYSDNILARREPAGVLAGGAKPVEASLPSRPKLTGFKKFGKIESPGK
jgi:hypothetical protein